MPNYYIGVPQMEEFYQYSLKGLLREDLGPKNFLDIAQHLSDIHNMIEEMIQKTELNDTISIGLKNEVITIVDAFNRFASLIMRYDFEKDAEIQFNQRKSIIQQVKIWYKSIFHGFDEVNQNRIENFLQVYNTIKLTNLRSFEDDKLQIAKLKTQLEETNKHATEVLHLLQTKASEETVQDYALIFQTQANKHSCFEFSLKPFRIKIGNSQRWLTISIGLLVVFAIIILNVQSILPIDFTKDSSIVSIQLITRLLLMSLSVFIIGFTFKQYNIQSHLHTLNKHRQNTLNSFKLFIGSLDTDDSITRNALMLEVAKAIYEAGHSGYISGKDGGDGSPSIIEMTRFVGQK